MSDDFNDDDYKVDEFATNPAPPVAYYDFYKTSGAKSVFFTVGPSLTRQEFADECDINAIMRRYEQAGAGVNGMPRNPNLEPMYVDFTTLPTDLLGYMDMMNDAEKSFMTLPATVRREFDNSPVMFVEFAGNPDNIDQMRAWGLAKPAPAEPPKASEPPLGDQPKGVVPEPPKAA